MFIGLLLNTNCTLSGLFSDIALEQLYECCLLKRVIMFVNSFSRGSPFPSLKNPKRCNNAITCLVLFAYSLLSSDSLIEVLVKANRPGKIYGFAGSSILDHPVPIPNISRYGTIGTISGTNFCIQPYNNLSDFKMQPRRNQSLNETTSLDLPKGKVL